MTTLSNLLCLVVAAVFAAVPPFPALAASPTLCAKGEKVVFSCPVKGKIVSVCASGTSAKEPALLSYRFGKVGVIELTYPTIPKKPAEAFVSGQSSYHGGGSTWLRFKNGGFTYTIFDAHERGQMETAGVAVERDDKEVANLKCNPNPENFDTELLESIGVPNDETAEPFVPPEAFYRN